MGQLSLAPLKYSYFSSKMGLNTVSTHIIKAIVFVAASRSTKFHDKPSPQRDIGKSSLLIVFGAFVFIGLFAPTTVGAHSGHHHDRSNLMLSNETNRLENDHAQTGEALPKELQTVYRQNKSQTLREQRAELRRKRKEQRLKNKEEQRLKDQELEATRKKADKYYEEAVESASQDTDTRLSKEAQSSARPTVYLRLQAGMAHEESTLEGGSNDAVLSGRGFGYGAALGVSINSTLSLHLSGFGDVNRVKACESCTLNFNAIGGGATIYIGETSGFFISPEIGAGFVDFDVNLETGLGSVSSQEELGEADVGIALRFTVGHETAVTETWGLGVLGSFGYHHNSFEAKDGKERTISGTNFMVGFGLTHH